MSHPDYEQQAYHHSCLLILIRGIGPSKPRSLQKIFERIQHVNNVKIKGIHQVPLYSLPFSWNSTVVFSVPFAIPDSAGSTRDIWVRYVRDYPVENNEWGDFQTHRRLLGLITVGKFDSQSELNEMCRVHESLKVKYTSTLFDSRCVLFASANNANAENEDPVLLSTGDVKPSDSDKNNSKDNENTQPNDDSLDTKILRNSFSTPSNFKSNVTFYAENGLCADLEAFITDFVNSLFWILEKKRLERSHEKLDKVPLLLAPFEKKDFVGLDMDTRNMRKRCVGRVTKNLADLTLQAGLVPESLNLFHAACETLRAISDSLWLGAATEGLCAASAILLYPHVRYTMSFQRNASLQENSAAKLSLARASSQSQENLSEHILNKKSNLAITLETDTSLKVNHLATLTSSSSTSSASSVTSTVSGSSTASSPSSMNHTASNDKVQSSNNPSNVLQPSDFVARYREAIINYSKYRHAGIIETEAALKAARICIEQYRYLDVAVFLQNVLYINLNLTEQERVQRFEVLTELYQRIGFTRKAAFCQRLASWRHVAQSNTNPDWNKSYRLMLESFPGHKLSLDPLEVIENNAGWKCLQIDLLQQLVAAARRIGHSALATRHMTFLLQTMWPHLSSNEQKEFSLQLQVREFSPSIS